MVACTSRRPLERCQQCRQTGGGKNVLEVDLCDYVARLLSRSDLEYYMDSTCDVLMDSIRQKSQPPKFVTGVSG